MSKYTFKRKEVKKEHVMNASASPEENTAVFVTAPKKETNSELEDLFAPEESTGFSLKNIFKHKSSDTDDELEAKLDDIMKEEDMSVDDIKNNLANGNRVDLANVFTDKKHHSEDAPVQAEEEDTYEGLEEPLIEEDEDEAPVPVEDEDIYVVEENDNTEEETPLTEKPKKVKKAKEVREYLAPIEKEEFIDIYKKKERSSLIKLILSAIATILLIYVETKALPHPEWLMSGRFGVLYLLIDMQLMFLSAFCVLDNIIDGAISLFSWKPNKNSIVFSAFLVSFLQLVLHLVIDRYSKDVTVYSSVFALTVTVMALVGYIDTRREHITFRVAAHSNEKKAATVLDSNSQEHDNFSEYLPEDASLYKISKVDFVSDFYKTTTRKSPFDESYKIIIPLVFAASIVFAILSAVLIEGANITSAINSFALAFMMAMPISSLFVVTLPYFITTLRLNRINSAIIGETAIDEYADTALISFNDSDVFNPKGIKITSIKTYGESRIDNTYLITAKAFNLVGGPLEDVFNRSVIVTATRENSDSIISLAENGFNAQIGSNNVFIGNQDYIEANGFTHIDDTIDKTFLSSNGRILYVAINGEVSAKFYVKYALGMKFKTLLDSFCNLGICMAINSRDPNLDTAFVTQILKDESYPIVVVKNLELPTPEENEPLEKASSGIVSASGVMNMLRTFLATDKLSRIISINTLAKYIALIFGFTLIVVAFLADGSHEKITPLFIMLYQLIWSLPIIGTSFFG